MEWLFYIAILSGIGGIIILSIIFKDGKKTKDQQLKLVFHSPQSEALFKLCQEIGASTMFTDCNDGMSLPLEVSKKIAIISIKQFCPEEYWDELINEIQKL